MFPVELFERLPEPFNFVPLNRDWSLLQVARVPDAKLRFWEENFPQLNPLKRKGGRRLYSVNDINLLRRIKELLNEEGYTVKGVKTYLSKKKISVIKEEGKLKLSRELSNKLLQMKETLQNIKKLYD